MDLDDTHFDDQHFNYDHENVASAETPMDMKESDNVTQDEMNDLKHKELDYETHSLLYQLNSHISGSEFSNHLKMAHDILSEAENEPVVDIDTMDDKDCSPNNIDKEKNPAVLKGENERDGNFNKAYDRNNFIEILATSNADEAIVSDSYGPTVSNSYAATVSYIKEASVSDIVEDESFREEKEFNSDVATVSYINEASVSDIVEDVSFKEQKEFNADAATISYINEASVSDIVEDVSFKEQKEFNADAETVSYIKEASVSDIVEDVSFKEQKEFNADAETVSYIKEASVSDIVEDVSFKEQKEFNADAATISYINEASVSDIVEDVSFKEQKEFNADAATISYINEASVSDIVEDVSFKEQKEFNADAETVSYIKEASVSDIVEDVSFKEQKEFNADAETVSYIKEASVSDIVEDVSFKEQKEFNADAETVSYIKEASVSDIVEDVSFKEQKEFNADASTVSYIKESNVTNIEDVSFKEPKEFKVDGTAVYLDKETEIVSNMDEAIVSDPHAVTEIYSKAPNVSVTDGSIVSSQNELAVSVADVMKEEMEPNSHEKETIKDEVKCETTQDSNDGSKTGLECILNDSEGDLGNDDEYIFAIGSDIQMGDSFEQNTQSVEALKARLLEGLAKGNLEEAGGERLVIKEEPMDTDLHESMITILVPHGVDENNMKLEPLDYDTKPLDYEYYDLDKRKIVDRNGTQDDTIEEIEDDEDFYIIQVADNTMARHLEYGPARPVRPANQIYSTPVTCDLCNYTTFDRSNLRKHTLIHTDLKPYSCSQCSFTCKLPKYLKQHQVTHMTLRLFPCSVCCHRCRNLTELNRHQKRHLRLHGVTSLDQLSPEQGTFCVCRDGCKAIGDFKRKKNNIR